MSFLQLVLSLDKTIKEIILFWRICQFDRYCNKGVVVFKENPLLLVVDSIVFNLVSSFAIDLKKHCSSCFNYYTVHTSSASDK